MFGIFFPWMHSQLFKCDLPSWVYLLDPGLVEGLDSIRYWRPDSLPLDPKAAKRYIQESLVFGGQFREPREITSLTGRRPENYFSNTSMALKSEMRRASQKSLQNGEEQSSQLILQAQMVLLLAWHTEENLIEYKEIEQGIQGQWKELWSSLGTTHEVVDPLSQVSSVVNTDHDHQTSLMSWQKILPWFLCFVHDKACLVFADRDIYKDMEENGISFDTFNPYEPSVEPDQGTLWSARSSGWDLCLRASSGNLPWLNKKYEIVFYHQGN